MTPGELLPAGFKLMGTPPGCHPERRRQWAGGPASTGFRCHGIGRRRHECRHVTPPAAVLRLADRQGPGRCLCQRSPTRAGQKLPSVQMASTKCLVAAAAGGPNAMIYIYISHTIEVRAA